MHAANSNQISMSAASRRMPPPTTLLDERHQNHDPATDDGSRTCSTLTKTPSVQSIPPLGLPANVPPAQFRCQRPVSGTAHHTWWARGEPIRSQPSQKTRRAPPLADHASVVSSAAADPSVTPIATASHSRRDPSCTLFDATPPSAIPVGTMFEAGGERDSPNRQALHKGHRSCQVSQRSTPVHAVAPADARPDGNALIRQRSVVQVHLGPPSRSSLGSADTAAEQLR